MWYIFDTRLACNASTEEDLLVFSSESWTEIAEFYDTFTQEMSDAEKEFIIITNYLKSQFGEDDED